jgi:hypothetical protein
MLIRLDEQALVEDLCAHFRRSGFSAESVGGAMAEVGSPDAANGDEARRAIAQHLRVWQIANPDVRAELV